MVQAVENRADLEGRLLEIRDDPSRPDHKLAIVDVSAVHDVASFPNLLGTVQGSRIEVIIPAAEAGSIEPGSVVRCRARRTGPRTVFAEQCTAVKR